MWDSFELPDRGFIFISEDETAPPLPPASFNLEDPATTSSGWVWLGSTSAQQRFTIETLENPEPDLFEGESKTLCHKPVFLKTTFTGLWGSAQTVKSVLQANRDESLGAWALPETVAPAVRSVMVVMVDEDGGVFGWYFNRLKMVADVASEASGDYFLGFSVAGYPLKPKASGPARVLKFDKAAKE
ncbi:hypothetical protein [Rothia nasimurium]|uniref:hypothetical protein n=1 Tax=Rothia nasimurium TaxID=85336 RepID=UPI003BA01F8A